MASNSLKRPRLVTSQLATYDDFDDDVVDVKGPARLSNVLVSCKVSQFINANKKKFKAVSGDDDLPQRDGFGERRRKYESRVLAGTGITTEDNNSDDNDFYKQVEKLRAAKLAAKAETYSRKSAGVSWPEETADGKRQINSQMLKNRGLTRSRNKAKRNPRKNYKLKHQKAVKNRKGQVQSIRIPTRPYGGESTGINDKISRSVRFKN
ncbi:something about silencing protein 10-like [Trifolium pratense]|uniref:something about silencing protein 10-like n=1 Tax=Trifolium pratense TaxID=57577 RepID=UPI001E692E11|nr:something about silencing protein 10-like [Trifolium pratense]